MLRSVVPALTLLSALLGLAAAGAVGATLEGEIGIWEQGRLFGENMLDDRSNAVVFIAGFKEPPLPQTPELAQQDKSFIVRVLAITQGQTVAFPNRDPIHHNVWSNSKVRPFDLGLYKAPNSKAIVFGEPGIVSVFCNIHPQMIATILVLPNSKFAVTEAGGRFRIENVPAGTHAVYAWVEGATPVRTNLNFGEGETVRADFRLQLKRIPLDHLDKTGEPYTKDGKPYR